MSVNAVLRPERKELAHKMLTKVNSSCKGPQNPEAFFGPSSPKLIPTYKCIDDHVSLPQTSGEMSTPNKTSSMWGSAHSRSKVWSNARALQRAPSNTVQISKMKEGFSRLPVCCLLGEL